MRVRCLENDLVRLVKDAALAAAVAEIYSDRDEPLDLKIGAEYVVFAIAHTLSIDWYYVLDDPTDEYPRWFPSALFEVVDATLPPDWLTLEPGRPDGLVGAPRVWADTPSFYERLLDEDPHVLTAFRALRLELEPSTEDPTGEE